jgi:hypothetical protein
VESNRGYGWSMTIGMSCFMHFGLSFMGFRSRASMADVEPL